MTALEKLDTRIAAVEAEVRAHALDSMQVCTEIEDRLRELRRERVALVERADRCTPK